MHYPVALFSFVLLAATSALAAPLNETLHFFGKRDNVCTSDFRSAVNKKSCLPHQEAFTFTAPSTINRVALPDQELTSVPAAVQCDHTIEIQLLDAVAKQSGLCGVLTALGKVDSTKFSKATLLENAAVHMSAIGNLNFLDGTVNNRKKTVVKRSFSGKKQETTDLDTAVGSYLTLVGQGVIPVAQQVDADIATIISTARTTASGIVAGKGRTDKNRILKQDLTDALSAYKAGITVTAAWKKVLTDAT